MIIFFYTSNLPKKDGVNIKNKDGKEMNIQKTIQKEWTHRRICIITNKFQKIALLHLFLT